MRTPRRPHPPVRDGSFWPPSGSPSKDTNTRIDKTYRHTYRHTHTSIDHTIQTYRPAHTHRDKHHHSSARSCHDFFLHSTICLCKENKPTNKQTDRQTSIDAYCIVRKLLEQPIIFHLCYNCSEHHHRKNRHGEWAPICHNTQQRKWSEKVRIVRSTRSKPKRKKTARRRDETRRNETGETK
mmetsp:Transcript_977/g.2425  ORF Transcript_977/g.2425 Transcript_977/m.2425 type:complete len:182 (+) Transcript_977:791-1336(+)